VRDAGSRNSAEPEMLSPAAGVSAKCRGPGNKATVGSFLRLAERKVKFKFLMPAIRETEWLRR
jgi:hypothetical protein